MNQPPIQPQPATSIPVVPPGATAPGNTQNLPQTVPPNPVDKANKIRQEKPKGNNTILIIVLIAVVVITVAGAGFLFLTEQGKNLIGLSSSVNESTSIDQDLPISDTTIREETPNDTTNKTNFSDLTATETVNNVLNDLESTLNLGNGSDDFDDFSSESEFGI